MRRPRDAGQIGCALPSVFTSRTAKEPNSSDLEDSGTHLMKNMPSFEPPDTGKLRWRRSSWRPRTRCACSGLFCPLRDNLWVLALFLPNTFVFCFFFFFFFPEDSKVHNPVQGFPHFWRHANVATGEHRKNYTHFEDAMMPRSLMLGWSDILCGISGTELLLSALHRGQQALLGTLRQVPAQCWFHRADSRLFGVPSGSVDGNVSRFTSNC